MTKTAAIYCRISRDMEGQGAGVERQEQLCRDLAKRMGLTVVDVYTDNDLGASSRSRKPRPEYQRMLSDARTGAFGVILAYSASRLTRRPLEFEDLIRLADDNGVKIHTVTSGTVSFETADSRAVARTIAAWDAAEAERLGERVAAQKAKALRDGRYIGGRVPFGWRAVDKTPQVHEGEAAAIRDAYRMLLSGLPMSKVADDWKERGILSKSGKPLGTTQITRIMLRARNAGLVVHHGETVNDNWPPIVDLTTFRQVEAILTDPARRQDQVHKRRYLLSGILLCHCGRKMTGYSERPDSGWYRCSVHQEGSRYVAGHALRRMQPLDRYITTIVCEYLTTSSARALLQDHDATRANQGAALPTSRELSELVGRRDALVRLFAQGTISEGQLTEGTAEVNQQIEAMRTTATRRTGSRVLASILVGPDPAAAFRDADVLQQRQVLKALLTVECLPNPGRGTFKPTSVEVNWI